MGEAGKARTGTEILLVRGLGTDQVVAEVESTVVGVEVTAVVGTVVGGTVVVVVVVGNTKATTHNRRRAELIR